MLRHRYTRQHGSFFSLCAWLYGCHVLRGTHNVHGMHGKHTVCALAHTRCDAVA